jgi:hypothetical protein
MVKVFVIRGVVREADSTGFVFVIVLEWVVTGYYAVLMNNQIVISLEIMDSIQIHADHSIKSNTK